MKKTDTLESWTPNEIRDYIHSLSDELYKSILELGKKHLDLFADIGTNSVMESVQYGLRVEAVALLMYQDLEGLLTDTLRLTFYGAENNASSPTIGLFKQFVEESLKERLYVEVPELLDWVYVDFPVLSLPGSLADSESCLWFEEFSGTFDC